MSKLQDRIDAAVDALKTNKDGLKNCTVLVKVLPDQHIRLQVTRRPSGDKEGLIIIRQDRFPEV